MEGVAAGGAVGCGDTTPTARALAWLLSRPGATAPILGPRTVEQLDTALPALELELDHDALAQLDDIFPCPRRSPRGVLLIMTA